MTSRAPDVASLIELLAGVDLDPPPAPAASTDWAALLALAEAHGVAAALAFRARRLAAGALPPGTAEPLARHFADGVRRHVLMSDALVRTLGALEAAEIPAIPLKGAVLAETLYPHPALRPYHDLDLLVREPDVRRADRVLRDHGYRRWADAHSWEFDVAHDGSTVYESAHGVRVDLHWRLITEGRYAVPAPEETALWERAAVTPVAGRPVLTLAREDLLLYLAVHLAVHHALTGLVWQWDVARLLRRARGGLDWEAVIDRARRWSATRALFFTLTTVARAFGVAAPAAVVARLRPRGPRARVMTALLRNGPPGALDHVVPLLLIDSGMAATRAVGRSVWPARAWLRARYGTHAPSALGQYVAHGTRLARVVTASGGALLGRVAGARLGRRPRG